MTCVVAAVLGKQEGRSLCGLSVFFLSFPIAFSELGPAQGTGPPPGRGAVVIGVALAAFSSNPISGNGTRNPITTITLSLLINAFTFSWWVHYSDYFWRRQCGRATRASRHRRYRRLRPRLSASPTAARQ